jgi:SAM-dependent methyltransferase
MAEPKGWDWKNANQSPWLKPTEDSYYLSNKWKEKGYKSILDLGTGLGRHAIYFSKQGFNVYAIDISEYGINHLNTWADNESVSVDTKIGDMESLPYKDNMFDCLFAYHVISHADSTGVKRVISEIKRVLRTGGEVLLSFCSKESWSFTESNFPKTDENTVINQLEGPEYGVPHFYCDLDDILNLLCDFEIEKIRHIDYCYMNSTKQTNKYYYVNAILK